LLGGGGHIFLAASRFDPVAANARPGELGHTLPRFLSSPSPRSKEVNQNQNKRSHAGGNTGAATAAERSPGPLDRLFVERKETID
jgi:hypothetical protein